MRVLGVIPARGGSKAIPGKNLADLGGIPLLHWTTRAARRSRLTRTIVSTDDEAIAEAARDAGVEVPFVRPAALATDDASSIDVAAHALEQLGADGFDAVMLLQPTTPFRTSDDIDDALATLDSSDADSVIGVVDVGGHHPARMKFVERGRLVDPPYAEEFENQPRQQLEPVHIRNGAVYLTRVPTLLSGSFRGRESRALVMPPERSINIDTPLDLLLARAIVREGLVAALADNGPTPGVRP